MAILTANLPVPLVVGAGAAVDVSSMGLHKTFTVDGAFPGSIVIIEASIDGDAWAEVARFPERGGSLTLACAARYLHARVAGELAIDVNADVAGEDADTLYVELPMPAGNGVGAAVDVSELGSRNFSAIVGGSLGGAGVAIEISEDGNGWVQATPSFLHGDTIQHFEVAAAWMRAVVRGRSPGVAFSGSLWVAAATEVAAGAGGGEAGPQGETGEAGPAGETGPAGTGFASGDKIVTRIALGMRTTHDSETPLVVGAASILPSAHAVAGMTMTARLEVVAATSAGAVTAHARLYNLTDAEVTGTVLNFAATTPTKATAALTIGASAGNLKTTEKIYEAQIYLDVAPVADETIELYSAYLVLTNTVP